MVKTLLLRGRDQRRLSGHSACCSNWKTRDKIPAPLTQEFRKWRQGSWSQPARWTIQDDELWVRVESKGGRIQHHPRTSICTSTHVYLHTYMYVYHTHIYTKLKLIKRKKKTESQPKGMRGGDCPAGRQRGLKREAGPVADEGTFQI